MNPTFNLAEVLTFPLKDGEGRKNFLIFSLVYFLSFFIPLLPFLVAMGYTARLVRAVVNGESPRMPAWNDWESMLKDGLILIGVRLIYIMPLLVIFFPLFLGITFLPLWIESSGNANELLTVIFFTLTGAFMLFIVPLSLAIGIIIPAAEIHAVVNNDFSAGIRIRAWWPIFRTNWIGFLLAYLIAMAGSIILSSLVGIAMITIIFFCIVPFLMPAITAYLSLVMYAAFAHAYKEGKERLA